MKTVESKTALREALAAFQPDATVGLVPTMGFLHEGHLSLMRKAREECDVVVATIFVNPTQFEQGEDLDSYPRDARGDADKCADAGVDLLWTPAVSTVYEPDHSTEVKVSGLTAGLCGQSRPNHFAGVTTIVSKLFNLTQPDRAYFGQKDYQQLAVIRRMVRDLDFPIDIVGMPIVREPDGLAMSSRNAYLSERERKAGLCLSRALDAAQLAWNAGERIPSQLRDAMRRVVNDEPLARIDYAEIVDPTTLEDLTEQNQPVEQALGVLAVFIGETRLIDNARIDEP